MKLNFRTKLNTLILFLFLLSGAGAMSCSTLSKKQVGEKQALSFWEERNQDKQLTKIQLGVPAYNATNLIYKRNEKPLLHIELSEPVVVSVASKPEKWGYFQFPEIYRAANGQYVVTWNMIEDAASGYGKDGFDFKVSTDARTWETAASAPFGRGLLLPTGDRISVYTPPAIQTNELQLSNPVFALKDGSSYGRTFTYYRYDNLPDTLKGIYLNSWDKTGKKHIMHAPLEDPSMLRYTDDDYFPIVWWGDMKLLRDNSIFTGVYPSFYEDDEGKVGSSGVSFYQSNDNGRSWKIKSKIPHIFDPKVDPNGYKRAIFGFSEPAFEVLSDGTFLCVMRTTDGNGISPMYISRSFDKGTTWTTPKVFTPNGVLPRLLQLENGVLVLASGRPGLQLRFSIDGKGEEWTDPIDMLPYEGTEEVSCGYPQLLATGSDRFLVVYSDFKYKIESGEQRKSIKLREIVITDKVKKKYKK